MRSRNHAVWVLLISLIAVSPAHAGLVAYWRLNNSASPSIDVVNGLSASWGSGVSATTTNCRIQGCLSFDDTTNALLTVTTPAALNLTTALSVAVWVRPASTTQNGLLEKTVGGAINTQYLLFIDGDKYLWRVDKGGTTTIQNDGTAAAALTHVVATYDGSTLRMYINSVLQAQTASVTAPIDGGSGNFLLGTLAGGTYPLNGTLDEVRIFDHALSQGEITRLYTRARAR